MGIPDFRYLDLCLLASWIQGYYNHVVVEGPITQTKWSHMPITFSSQDVNLTSFPHIDAIVATVHIDRWDVTKILIDSGS
jgi:hypothetical protein